LELSPDRLEETVKMKREEEEERNIQKIKAEKRDVREMEESETLKAKTQTRNRQ